jgi:hypothetical protein
VLLLEQLMPGGPGVKYHFGEANSQVAEPIPQGAVGNLELFRELGLGEGPGMCCGGGHWFGQAREFNRHLAKPRLKEWNPRFFSGLDFLGR